MNRRRALMGAQGEIDEGNLVVSFSPITKYFSHYTKIDVPLTEAIVKGKEYRVVLDATVPTGHRFLVLLGAVNNFIEYFPEGQDGIVEKTWKTNTTGNATTAMAYIYCRAVSGTESVTATVRNIKVYKEGW